MLSGKYWNLQKTLLFFLDVEELWLKFTFAFLQQNWMRSNDDDDDDIMVRPGHESLLLGGERSSRTFFCPTWSVYAHSRSFGCIWPAFAVFQFCTVHMTRVQVPVCIYVPMDACDQPFTLTLCIFSGTLSHWGPYTWNLQAMNIDINVGKKLTTCTYKNSSVALSRNPTGPG